MPQPREGRVSFAEIVDSDTNSEGFRLPQRTLHLLRLAHCNGLDDFQLQIVSSEASPCQRVTNVLKQWRISQFRCRDIETQRQGGQLWKLQLPALYSSACFQPQPPIHRYDQPSLLCDFDELPRRNQSSAGTLPADQRLEAGDYVC